MRPAGRAVRPGRGGGSGSDGDGLAHLLFRLALGPMRERGGCLGTDSATPFLLDKSTASRRIAVLERNYNAAAGTLRAIGAVFVQRSRILRQSWSRKRCGCAG